ncbi:MAG: hypothetical protein M3X11_13315 [Acidobacteriota bacterium]|nr:hypothetical protein [Acidobacteriota bacterium]
MKVKTQVKAGGITFNHNQTAVRVKTGVKAAGPGLVIQHNQTVKSGLKVKSNVKSAGPGVVLQHNQTVKSSLKVKTSVKAGGSKLNHNQTVVGAIA